MKPLYLYNNVEKAKMLFELLPEEIPAFLEFQKAITDNLMRDPDQLKEKWENQLLNFEFWMRLASEVQSKLIKYTHQLSKRSRLFADQLFDGYLALYSAHCLIEYVKHQKPDKKFIAAVNMFF